MPRGKPGPKRPIELPDLDFTDAPERGWPRIVWFAETYLKVPKGVGAKEPFRLRDWQVDILRELFPTAQERPRPRQGLLSLPRGNGKTGLAAVLAVYGMFADEVEGAQVLIVASDERTAQHVYKAAERMIETSPELDARTHYYHDYLAAPLTDSTLRALPADESALQGWDPSLLLVDELHVVTQKVWDAATSAVGKRAESMTLAISTPSDNTDSVMHRLVTWAKTDPDPSFVFVEYAADEGCRLGDVEQWRKANPALGDFLFEDAMRAKMKTLPEPAFRRYMLGQWVGSENSWLPFGFFETLADQERAVTKREKVVLAFDGSSSGDSTVLVGATVAQPHHLFVVGMWENPDLNNPGWRVDRADVDKAVRQAFRDYNVVEMACDPWGWQTEIQSWAKRHGSRRVVQFNTAHAQRMAPATDVFYELAMEGGITHDGDQRMVAHYDHAVAKTTHLGSIISKDKKSSKRKIDSAVAGIMAISRAQHHSTRPARTGSFAA